MNKTAIGDELMMQAADKIADLRDELSRARRENSDLQALRRKFAVANYDFVTDAMIAAGEAVMARQHWEWNELWNALLDAMPEAA